MQTSLRAAIAALLLGIGGAAQAQDADAEAQAFLNALHHRSGEIAIGAAHAKLALNENFTYLDQADARRVLEEFWGNPPDESVLGLLVPKAEPLGSEHSWAVVLTYSGDGHVSDEDAQDIDYAELLSDMQQESRDSNEELKEAGYPAVDLVGWAQPPRYDVAGKRLHWAKELAFEGNDGHTLNYDIRVLGREGYLSMNAVADMADMARVNAGMSEVLQMARFEPGQTYADFNESTDHMAEYGLAALVGGGIAAKTGLLAKLGVLLLSLKKGLVLIVAAIAAFVKKLFGKKEAKGTVS